MFILYLLPLLMDRVTVDSGHRWRRLLLEHSYEGRLSFPGEFQLILHIHVGPTGEVLQRAVVEAVTRSQGVVGVTKGRPAMEELTAGPGVLVCLRVDGQVT